MDANIDLQKQLVDEQAIIGLAFAKTEKEKAQVSSDHSIQEFRESVTSFLLSEHDFIDWDSVSAGISGAKDAAAELDKVRSEGEVSIERLAVALGEHPQIYDVALSLIAFNTSGSQVSKWGLGPSVPTSLSGRQHLARQLLHIGLGKVLAGTAPITDLLTIAEVYKDSFRRRFRSGDRFGGEVDKIVRATVKMTVAELAQPVQIQNDSLADPNLRRSLDYVVAIAGRPIVGIATVFQNQSGGRQQRDLSVTYPILQQKLSEYGMSLVLIADGRGIAEASDRTLLQLFENVSYPMTIKQAREGALMTALMASAQQPAPETLDATAVARLITGALDARDTITTEELPLANGPAILALARYAESHRNLALKLSSTGEALGWTHPEFVGEARRIAVMFDSRRALDLIAHRLDTKIERTDTNDGLVWATIPTPESPPYTGKILVVAHGPGLTADARKNICRYALELTPGSAFAILLAERDLNSAETEAHRKRQAVLPVNIVIIGPKLLRQIARAANPVEILNKVVLDQSDLAKVSPFILSNATPTRMFFGRAAEAATILGTVATNSVALLGSRRIGKTSLLRHVHQELQEANFRPFFGDCQTVKTWDDFAALAKAEWGVDTAQQFRPQHLGGLVQKLSAGSEKPVVILLDEIDQLLEWDRTHEEDSVPEAFFRACRSLSQEGAVQFVFSGERMIAQRIWDPESPHWNFCRPLALAQLTSDAATSLLVRPLKAIGIRIEDEIRFGAEAWRLTSGHPQIAQYLGDRLVRRLDSQSNRTELQLNAEDIVAVAETYEYAEHYLNTYWGQANSLEREISLMVAKASIPPRDLLSELKNSHPTLDEGSLEAALRMLQLYGIIIEEEGEIRLRAAWFNEARSYFGGTRVQLPEEAQ
ncbi:DpnII family type II restriction endonuclease [Roseibium aggregatum]|uniref:DpnII family type II restriction endonuclease n=1 Tax=Roseibium aggregatum TaxID=187304 RepID=UPI0025AD6AF9|nr:ATP-binding protein [Roseibium aggregatum]WJS03180.1 ATP-binding protein [Roseibium aggregatum]